MQLRKNRETISGSGAGYYLAPTFSEDAFNDFLNEHSTCEGGFYSPRDGGPPERGIELRYEHDAAPDA